MFDLKLEDHQLTITSPYYDTAIVQLREEWDWFEVRTNGIFWCGVNYTNPVALVEAIVSAMLYNWTPDPDKSCPGNIIREWKKHQLFRMLYKRVNQFRLEMLKDVDPKHIALHKRIYAATGKNISGLPQWIFKDPYLVSDLYRFNFACAVLLDVISSGLDEKNAVNNGAWRDWYEGKRTKATNIIMNQYPRAMPLSAAHFVPQIEWERPITNRRQLLFVMQVFAQSGRYHWSHTDGMYQDSIKQLLHVAQHATPDEIKHCILSLAQITGANLSPNKAEDIAKLVLYIVDGIEEDNSVGHAQTLNSFLKRAHEAHTSMYYRLQREAEQQRLEMEGKLTQATALPPVALPKDDKIHFLKTAYDVWYEGVVMQHCVGGYADRAIAGHSYLFHVEFNEYHATAEVTPDGYVSQIYGTRNTHNPACDYGQRVLGKWAKQILKAS